MRLSLRFIIPLFFALAGIAWLVIPLVDRLTLTWFVRDLDVRATLVARAIQPALEELLRADTGVKTARFFDKITEDERLFAIGFCGSRRGPPIATRTFPPEVQCGSLDRFAGPDQHVLAGSRGPLHVAVKPVELDGVEAGKLVVVHDMSFVQRRSDESKRYLFLLFVGLGLVTALITVAVAQLSWRGWLHGMRALLRGEGLLRPAERIDAPELQPIASDLRSLIRDLRDEYRPRDEDQTTWSAETLRSVLREDLRGDDVLVVSNREPYIHERRGDRIEVRRPASGLVTALEPVVRACSGTWIAHGSGSADRDVVDERNRIAVPPDRPAYSVRRVWLTREEEAGYYYGFANEGLWPLCHIAHVRPIFRTGDWIQYVNVNRKFARAVVEEARRPDPIVLVQDYHFALAPRMIRDELPKATIVAFWHIPWPNPESFAICPWRDELLDGMLGSSILGFHTQYHCNNFVDTVDRLIEARVDRETFTISYGGKLTEINRYPISIEWPPSETVTAKPIATCRAEVRARLKLPPEHAIGVGVDRMDYTKGILERFRAIERLLEIEPQWIGRFTFVQVAAPTRSSIEEYQAFEAAVRTLAARINARFADGGHPPIVLRVEHYEPPEVNELFRAADLCVVSSLHDGMNLVAKEFVASREDERGVLILSQFTGAARELPESLVVNPYDVDECAAALRLALAMPLAEQRSRMRVMRGLVREFNVFRWAGRMLLDAAGMRRRDRIQERPAARVAPLRRTLGG